MFASAVKSSIRKCTAPKALTFAGSVRTNNFATYKSSTGLVGLAVDPNGRETLQKAALDILSAVKVF
jgi:hypothetical protein